MEAESMKKLKATVEKCLEELAKKGDLTPAETKAALDGMELRDLLKCEIEECRMQEQAEYSERGYSGHEGIPYRQYHITSYGMPVYPNEHRRPGYSGDYGIQGWYRSNDERGMRNAYCGPYYDAPDYSERKRYSRHSIGDRVVAKLEKMMDSTESEYEQEELHKFIRLVREAAD